MIIRITTCEWEYDVSADGNNDGEYCSGIYIEAGRGAKTGGRGSSQGLLLKEGSFANICRYRPTPESSDGAGDATGPFAVDTGVLVAAVAEVAWEVFRERLRAARGMGERVLVSQAGLVMVALA
jgi:hypothetical protein